MPILIVDDSFTHNLLVFSRLLRFLGLDVSPDQVADFTRVACMVGAARREDFYYAARAAFVRRHSDQSLFDAAFDLFFRIHGSPQASVINPVQKPARRVTRPATIRQAAEKKQARAKCPDNSQDNSRSEIDNLISYSPAELLRQKNFGSFSPEEIREARRLIAEMDWQVGQRKTRRKRRSHHGTQIDMTRVVRSNLKYGAEVMSLPEREIKLKARPLVVLADVSGSMERYTRMVLQLLHTLSHENQRVEVYTFGTRLTRITSDLKRKDVDAALDRASRRVPDWSGGTRIGEALKTFNFKWARRVLRAGAVVLMISDGWDRGDLQLLRTEMERLQRSCYRLIWLNPLIGSPSYEPTAQGMNVALTFVDDFLPVHNVLSLEALVAKLSTLESARPLRRQRPKVTSPATESLQLNKTMELPQMGTSDYMRRTMTLRMMNGVPTFLYEDNPS